MRIPKHIDGGPVTQGDPASVDLDAIFARMDALEAWELGSFDEDSTAR